MNKVLFIFFVILVFLTSCGKESSPTAPADTNAYLKITNTTSDRVSVTFSDGFTNIEAGQTYTRTFTSAKTLNVMFSYTGTYVMDNQQTVQVSPGNTTTVSIAPTAGCITYTNSTNASLNLQFDHGSYTIQANSSRTFKYNMPYSSSEMITCLVSGTYYFSGNYSSSVYRNSTTIKYLSANAGAIKIVNNSSYSISSIYLSPSSDSSWGADDLTGYLYSGYNITWTASAGLWDIKIVSTNGYYYTYLSRQVVNDNTYTINFYGSKKESDGDSPAKHDGGYDNGRANLYETIFVSQ